MLETILHVAYCDFASDYKAEEKAPDKLENLQFVKGYVK